jgi:hypothetical protein
MINTDRIVPITKIDYLSMIGTVLAIANVSTTALAAKDVEGTFEITGSGSVGNFLANQPVKTLDFKSGVTAATAYFCAAHDFEGLKVAGADPTVNASYLDNDDVVGDGVTLYKAALSGGTVTMTKVTPEIVVA